MNTYLVCFSEDRKAPIQLADFRPYKAVNAQEAAIAAMRHQHRVPESDKTLWAHVAPEHWPKHSNGMPIVLHAFQFARVKEVPMRT